MDVDVLDAEAIGAACLERISLSSFSDDMPGGADNFFYEQRSDFEGLVQDALGLSDWGAPVDYVMQCAMLRLGLVRDSFANIEWGELDPPEESWSRN